MKFSQRAIADAIRELSKEEDMKQGYMTNQLKAASEVIVKSQRGNKPKFRVPKALRIKKEDF